MMMMMITMTTMIEDDDDDVHYSNQFKIQWLVYVLAVLTLNS